MARTFFVTAAAFGALSLYGYTTKRDLSAWGKFLFMGLIGLILAGLVNMFWPSGTMSFIISAVGVLIFSALIAYDTQKIKEQYAEAWGTDVVEKVAIFGALSLYLDFVNLFQFLMSFWARNANSERELSARRPGAGGPAFCPGDQRARRNRLREFIDSEAASAMPLLAAAVAALVLANSPFADAVDNLLRIRFGFSLGPLVLDKSVYLVNDGLMALFLLVGLEIKREVVEGALSQPSQVACRWSARWAAWPCRRWSTWRSTGAIPRRSRAGRSRRHRHRLLAGRAGRTRQPRAADLKVFLTTLAIVDDLGAIVVIAIFYTSDLSPLALGMRCSSWARAILNFAGVRRLLPICCSARCSGCRS